MGTGYAGRLSRCSSVACFAEHAIRGNLGVLSDYHGSVGGSGRVHPELLVTFRGSQLDKLRLFLAATDIVHVNIVCFIICNHEPIDI